ncbi:MAG: glycosyltransferase family 2 protein, partial [Verrucomicrobiales bacterium]
DEEAEHLPGCNLAVTRAAFQEVAGFDAIFHTAGDDVDFCWRLRQAGYRLGFAPGAFVWHWRRPSVRAFLRQQRGYGEAERLLLGKHPQRFTPNGNAIWNGFVYNGGPLRVIDGSVIHHGSMGLAGYQSVVSGMMPLRGIDPRFDSPFARLVLAVVTWLQPRMRSWSRRRLFAASPDPKVGVPGDKAIEEFRIWSEAGRTRQDLLTRLLAEGWQASGETDCWDVERGDTRLLLATEQSAGIGRRTLVRVWGKRVSGLEQMLLQA